MIYQINSIRAIACLAVVIVHITAVFYFENKYFSKDIFEYINQIARFGTPIFCIITGFLFSNYFFNNFNINNFFKSRFEKILIPYLLWSLFYLALVYFFLRQNFPENILYSIILGKSFYHLYFISIILQFCILFPILRKIKFKNDIITVFTFFIINLLCLIFFKESDFFILSESSFLGFWIFYFYFGLYFNKIIHFLQKLNLKLVISTLFIILLIMCLEIYLSEQIFGSRRVLNLFIVPPIFVILFWIFSKKQSKALNFIGYFSMGIYLIHPIVILILKRIIGIDLIHEKPLFFSIILLIFTLIITICLILIIVKFPFSKYLLTVSKK